MKLRRLGGWLVGLGGAAAVEHPVAEVEHGEDDREALARQFVNAPSVVLAVVRRRCRRRQRGRQRAGHHRLRVLGGRRRRLVMPVVRRRLDGGGDARARRGDEWLVDARYHRNAVHAAATDHRRVTDRRVCTAMTSSVGMLQTHNNALRYSSLLLLQPLAETY